jgi:hypothetical protein
MDCILCDAELLTGEHFLCRDCLSKVSIGDARRVTQCEIFLKAMNTVSVPRFDNLSLRDAVSERLVEIEVGR